LRTRGVACAVDHLRRCGRRRDAWYGLLEHRHRVPSLGARARDIATGRQHRSTGGPATTRRLPSRIDGEVMRLPGLGHSRRGRNVPGRNRTAARPTPSRREGTSRCHVVAGRRDGRCLSSVCAVSHGKTLRSSVPSRAYRATVALARVARACSVIWPGTISMLGESTSSYHLTSRWWPSAHPIHEARQPMGERPPARRQRRERVDPFLFMHVIP
jgi:hypothetical protein